MNPVEPDTKTIMVKDLRGGGDVNTVKAVKWSKRRYDLSRQRYGNKIVAVETKTVRPAAAKTTTAKAKK